MNIKKIFKFVWNEFIYSGHLISLGAVSIVFTSAILLDIKITWDCLIIIYLLTFSCLLYNRYKEQKIDILINSTRTKYLVKYFDYIFLIIFFSVLISIGILLYYYKILVLLYFIFLFLFSLCYTKYLKTFTWKIKFFKNICFSLIASLLLVFLIFYYSYPFLNIPFALIFIFIFLRMFVNTVFLDIKDMQSDRKIELLTFPILFGKEKTLIFLKGVTILSVLPIIFGVCFDLLPKFSLILLLIIPYSFYYFNKSRIEKNFYLVNYFLADMEFILWTIFILLAKVLI